MYTLNFLKDNNLTDESRRLMDMFYKKKITVSYEQASYRFIFTCSKNLRRDTFDEICRECNGLILAYSANEWHPLVIPMHSPKSNFSTNKAASWLKRGLYQVYKMEDGTVANLYYFGKKWIISTARGIEVNSIAYNSCNYQNMIEECLKNSNINPEEFYAGLNQECCYTIGFKHPDLHMFHEGKDPIYKIWGIQFVHLAELDKPIRDSFGLPLQNIHEFNFRGMNTFYSPLSSALTDFINHGKINYGYIFVSNDPEETREYSMVMLESQLMTNIRNYWYNSKYNEFARKNGYDRQKVILLSAFLHEGRRATFLALFPQYASEFEQIEARETSLCEAVAGIHDSSKEVINPSHDPLVNAIASIVAQHHVAPSQEYTPQQVRQILRNTKNIDLYLGFI